MTTRLGAAAAACVFAVGVASTAAGQPLNVWMGNGPYGGSVAVLAVHPSDPTILFAGTHFGGIFRSADGGSTWTSWSTAVYVVNALAIDPGYPDTMYAGDPPGNVFKSSDGGLSWTQLAAFNTPLFGLSVDPGGSRAVYAATGGRGVLRSTDGGASWTDVNNGLTDLTVNALAMRLSYPGWMLAATTSGVFRSTDGGDSWTFAGPSSWINSLAVAGDGGQPQTILAGGSDGVYQSLDGGDTWLGPSAPGSATVAGVTALVFDPVTALVVYAGVQNGGGVWRSLDGGASWEEFSEGMTARNVQCLVAAHREGEPGITLHAGSHYISGVFTRTWSGATWTEWLETSEGMSPGVNSLVPDPANPGTVYAGTPAGVFKGTRNLDGTTAWLHRDAGIAGGGVIALALAPASPGEEPTIYAAVGRADGGVYKTTDGGQTWKHVYRTSPHEGRWMEAIAVAPSDANAVYAGIRSPGGPGTGGGVMTSRDGGATWSGPFGDPDVIDVTVLAVSPVNRDVVYAGTDGGLFRSEDGGSTWTPLTIDSTPLGVPALALDPTNSQIGFAGTNGGAFRTSDGGATWVPVTGLSCPRVSSLSIVGSGTTLYAAACGVYRSVDAGATWHRLPDLDAGGGPAAVAGDPFQADLVYAATLAAGVFHMAYQNNPPVFVPPTPVDGRVFEVTAGSHLEFTVRSEDPEIGDMVALSAAGLPPGAGFGGFGLPSNPEEGVFMWTPGPGQVGQYPITFRTWDPAGAFSTTSVVVDVVAAPNRPPKFYGPSDGQVFTAPSGQKLWFTVRAADDDPGQMVTLRAVDAPQGAVFGPTGPANPVSGTFEWTPGCTTGAGTQRVSFVATDDAGATATISVVIDFGPRLDATDRHLRSYRPTSDVDVVDTGGAVIGNLSWNFSIFNGSPCAVSNPTVTVTSGLPASAFLPPPGITFPFTKSASTLGSGQMFTVNDLGAGRSTVVDTFVLGFRSSRSVSPVVIPPGGTLQTVTVTLELTDPAFLTDGSNLGTGVSGFKIVSATMDPNNTGQGETVQQSCQIGGTSCGWALGRPQLNKIYTFSVTMEVANTTGLPSTYKPAVTAGGTPGAPRSLRLLDGISLDDPSLDGSAPGMGGVTFSIGGSGLWSAAFSLSREVRFASLPVNWPPVFLQPEGDGQTVTVEAGDDAAPLTVTARDVESAGLVTLGVASLPPGAAFPIPPPARTVTSALVWPAAGPAGRYPVLFTATDNRGATTSRSVTIDVVDTTAPTVTNVTASPGLLWPPNHQMVPIGLVVDVLDAGTRAPVCRVVSVESNQPAEGVGDGRTTDDWVFSGAALDLSLRAERSGGRGDRIYTAFVTCRDEAGNESAPWPVMVRVPANQGK